MRCRSIATFFFGAAPQIQCALHPYPQGRRGAGRLQPSPSELRHKYNVRSIPIRKDDEVQVDCNLLLRSYATNTMFAPSLSARTMRCRSTAMCAPSLPARTMKYRSTGVSTSELHLKH